MEQSRRPLLFRGRVAHTRHAPFRHRFAYRLWMVMTDLDRPSRTKLFAGFGRGLVSLRERDHGPRDGGGLRAWADETLAAHGMDRPARISFLSIPRVWGFAFNPIAFFFCHDDSGALTAIIHQVHNTFGEQHCYVLPARPSLGTIRQSARKSLYVSPFFDMSGGYRFTLTAPDPDQGGAFDIVIAYGARDEPRLTATMRLRGSPMTDRALLSVLAAMPLMPFKVVAAIHWQALRLWWRGARLQPRRAQRAPGHLTSEEHA